MTKKKSICSKSPIILFFADGRCSVQIQNILAQNFFLPGKTHYE